jgi:hypothetical protein
MALNKHPPCKHAVKRGEPRGYCEFATMARNKEECCEVLTKPTHVTKGRKINRLKNIKVCPFEARMQE